MKIYELIEKLDIFAPFDRQESWDNCGLLIGDENNRITGISLCLDTSERIIDFAIKNDINTIISHHPIIFKGITKINGKNERDRIIKKAVKNDINIIAMHTNLDFANRGINDYICNLLGLKEIKGYIKHESKNFYVGRVGSLREPKDLICFLETIKEKLKINNLRYSGKEDEKVYKILVTTGAFDEELTPADPKKIDTIITSDTKYHSVKDLYEKGIRVIDVNHFGSEHIVIDLLEKELKQLLDNVRIIKVEFERDIYNFM